MRMDFTSVLLLLPFIRLLPARVPRIGRHPIEFDPLLISRKNVALIETVLYEGQHLPGSWLSVAVHSGTNRMLYIMETYLRLGLTT